jgi:hypothetical protein
VPYTGTFWDLALPVGTETPVFARLWQVAADRDCRLRVVADEVDGELISEEDVETSQPGGEVRALPRDGEGSGGLPALRNEMTTAAIAVAGGALAGAATVAAVRAVSGGSKRRSRRLGRRGRPSNVVASRSFLVDVHMLGR